MTESVDDRIPTESGNDSQHELAGSTTSLMQCTIIRPQKSLDGNKKRGVTVIILQLIRDIRLIRAH